MQAALLGRISNCYRISKSHRVLKRLFISQLFSVPRSHMLKPLLKPVLHIPNVVAGHCILTFFLMTSNVKGWNGAGLDLLLLVKIIMERAIRTYREHQSLIMCLSCDMDKAPQDGTKQNHVLL